MHTRKWWQIGATIRYSRSSHLSAVEGDGATFDVLRVVILKCICA